jgi:hypothetical protein
MQGKGSAHIFVYYQKPGRFMAETGEWEEAKNAQKEFVVSEGTCLNRLFNLKCPLYSFKFR